MQKSNAPPNNQGNKSSYRYPAAKPTGGQVGSYKRVGSGYGVSGNTGKGGPVPHNSSSKYKQK